jgi:hypothetical protein
VGSVICGVSSLLHVRSHGIVESSLVPKPNHVGVIRVCDADMLLNYVWRFSVAAWLRLVDLSLFRVASSLRLPDLFALTTPQFIDYLVTLFFGSVWQIKE